MRARLSRGRCTSTYEESTDGSATPSIPEILPGTDVRSRRAQESELSRELREFRLTAVSTHTPMQRGENPERREREIIERRRVRGPPNFSLSHHEFTVTRTGYETDVTEFLRRQDVYRDSDWAGVYILSHKPPNSDEWKPYYVGEASEQCMRRRLSQQNHLSRKVEACLDHTLGPQRLRPAVRDDDWAWDLRGFGDGRLNRASTDKLRYECSRRSANPEEWLSGRRKSTCIAFLKNFKEHPRPEDEVRREQREYQKNNGTRYSFRVYFLAYEGQMTVNNTVLRERARTHIRMCEAMLIRSCHERNPNSLLNITSIEAEEPEFWINENINTNQRNRPGTNQAGEEFIDLTGLWRRNT